MTVIIHIYQRSRARHSDRSQLVNRREAERSRARARSNVSTARRFRPNFDIDIVDAYRGQSARERNRKARRVRRRLKISQMATASVSSSPSSASSTIPAGLSAVCTQGSRDLIARTLADKPHRRALIYRHLIDRARAHTRAPRDCIDVAIKQISPRESLPVSDFEISRLPPLQTGRALARVSNLERRAERKRKENPTGEREKKRKGRCVCGVEELKTRNGNSEDRKIGSELEKARFSH